MSDTEHTVRAPEAVAALLATPLVARKIRDHAPLRCARCGAAQRIDHVQAVVNLDPAAGALRLLHIGRFEGEPWPHVAYDTKGWDRLGARLLCPTCVARVERALAGAP